MAEDVKIERVTDDDGRLVEKRTYETVLDGQKVIVRETHVEQVSMVLKERTVEKVTPVVRKKEVYDKDGKVVDTVVEEIDRSAGMTKEEVLALLRELLANKTEKPVEKAVTVNWKEYVELGLYFILSGELAFSVYHLVLKNWV